MEPVYRRWTRDDFKELRDVLWTTWLATYSPFIPEADLKAYLNAHYDEKAFQKLFEDLNLNCHVAEVEGHVAGFARTWYRATERRHYVSSIYILPRYQNFGIGTRLMQMAAEEARSRGLDRLWLGVMVQNRHALQWYQKHGFSVEREEPFTMGRSSVAHYIGHLPTASFLDNNVVKRA